MALRERANPRRSDSRRFFDSGEAESGLREGAFMGQADARQGGTWYHVRNLEFCTGRVERTPSIWLPGEAESGGNPIIGAELRPVEVLPDCFANFESAVDAAAGFEEIET